MRRRPMRRGSRWRSRSAGEATSMCGTSTRPWRCSGSAPILMEGALQGVLGAAVAVGAVLAAQHWLLPHASQAFAVAAGVGAPHLVPAHAATLLAAGALVGFGGSWIAVARFLKT